MFKKFTNGCVNLVQKYLPDPFIFAVLLTFFVLILGIVLTGQSPLAMTIHWSKGLWTLLAFSMQMALVLVTGHALANAPSFKKGLKTLAKIPKSPSQAIILVTLISTIACWINWGFGLVIGAIFAKELAKEVKGVDYRLLIASAYSGFLVWHAGLSGSIPLVVASGGPEVVKATAGVVTSPIPTSATLFSGYNLIILAVLLITLPLINKAMHPDIDHTVTIDTKLLVENPVVIIAKEAMTPADKLENSTLISMLLAIMGFSYIVYYFVKGGSLDLNIVNAIFLFLGVALHGTPRRFVNAITDAAKGAAGIILQFPFYAGIMGMMVGTSAAGISLAGVMSTSFVSISNQHTFPLFTFLSAGLVNFFIPSGGGQWAVQAPIMMPAGAALGVPAAKTAMAIAWGDAWTNMIQPFWALPALGIAGLSAKDVMGFCVIDLLYSGIIIGLGLFLF
ncbi:short-chain fatty acid transporter [Clostridium sp. CM028]|uniref:short-chain fatty acid transporter n=1 Tax=unclassified Clostridium TaxID=2614128 RepID=UPI001C6E1BB1|nr:MULTISPECIES: short-chain fatty acid transporter [unclassified Clostridium]MBW9146831.1 short-chain fatty acid transporter [Clostridium sp. CM027]MBW9150148.1 short-chain fatty acid transporter [Clostridium sp. CM028]UVE39690.1 short-chain fatty acid transporter [Clostridium sp. CM027]WLC60393.1 short-chain fatty acid transporter [Clostridium sp. CM028]